MDIFLNELSLQGQFKEVKTFLNALKEVIKCRDTAHSFQKDFYCLRNLAERPVLGDMMFKHVIQQTRDMNLTRLVMGWLDKHGPFWEDLRRHQPDDWFEFNNEIVTDCSLAEAAFCASIERAVSTVTFNPSSFCINPIDVIRQRNEQDSEIISIPNFWNSEDLQSFLEHHQQAPQSWPELLAQAKVRFTNLVFLEEILDHLKGEPFSRTIADRAMFLLNILNQLKSCFDEQGALTNTGHQLLVDYFQGEDPWFTDESDTNKHLFRSEMTFKTADGHNLFCPFHGKINYRYYRIHHSWPILYNEPLYIAYIGPKITKK